MLNIVLACRFVERGVASLIGSYVLSIAVRLIMYADLIKVFICMPRTSFLLIYIYLNISKEF